MGEPESAKTFNSELNEFTPTNYPVDLNELESLRFFDSQLNLISSQLSKLTRALATGMTVFETSEGLKQLEAADVQQRTIIERMESQSKLMEKYKKRVQEMDAGLQAKAELVKLQELVKRMTAMEEAYEDLTSSKNKELFLNLIDLIDDLSARINNLEVTTEKVASTYFGARLEKVRKEIK
jgi:hypothetical protein